MVAILSRPECVKSDDYCGKHAQSITLSFYMVFSLYYNVLPTLLLTQYIIDTNSDHHEEQKQLLNAR